MPSIERDKAQLYYETYGESGPEVVFAHGAGGNTLIWWNQTAHFGQNHRTLCFDHRGFGRSHCPAEHAGAREFARDLEAIWDHAGIQRAALVCQSMGGWTGLHFALRNPDRVRCLVLSCTPAGIVTPGVVEAAGRIVREAGERAKRGAAVDPLDRPELAPDFPAREPALAYLYAQLTGLNPANALLNSKVGEIPVALESLSEFRVPTLVASAEHDQLFSPAVLREVADQIPGARFHEFAGSGHSPYFEQPDAFNRVVGDFIREYASA